MMTEPFHLTLEAVTIAARKAYDERRLTAQNGGDCVYRDRRTGCRCAIGWAMPDDLLDRLGRLGLMEEAIYFLESDLVMAANMDMDMISGLQSAHDGWVIDQRKCQEAEFLKQLERCKAEVERRKQAP